MKRNCFILTTLLLAALSWPAPAQRLLTLDECHALALENNRELAQAQLGQDVALNTHKAARTNYLPRLSAMGGYVRSGREVSLLNNDQKHALNTMGSQLTDGFTQAAQTILQRYPDLAPLVQQASGPVGSLGSALNGVGKDITDAFRTDSRNLAAGAVLLTQPLYMGGKIRAYDRLTAYQEDLAKDQFRAKRQEVLLETDRAYWQVVSLANKLKLAQSYRNTLQRLDTDVQKMIREGVATKANGLQVAVKLNEAEVMVTKVDNGLALSRMLLCQLCGLPLDTDLRTAHEASDSLNVSLDDVDVPDPQTAFSQRPELAQLETATHIYAEKINIVRSEFLPHLALLGAYGMTYPNLYNGFEKHFRGDWHLGLTLNVPVWNWFEGRHKVRAAKAEAEMASLRLSDASEKVALQVRQETFRVNEANKRCRLAATNLAQADENLRMATLGYKEGVIAMTDVLEAQTAWLQANSEKIDAQIDGLLARTSLKKALGTLQ